MAALAPLKTFKGGHYFGLFEGTPRGKRLQAAPLPKRVIIPLRQGFSAEVPPTVKEGDLVKAGQIIGRAEPNPAKPSTPVHASISGRVVKIEKRPHPLGGEATTVQIESDGKDEWLLLERTANYEQLSPEELGKILYEAGVTSGGSAGFPTIYHSAPTPPDQIRYLIINAVETEPFWEATDQLLYEEFEKFVQGIKILRAALGSGVHVHIGVGYNKPRIYEELVSRLKQYDWCTIHRLRPKYPQGDDAVLIRTLLGLLLPQRGYATDVGCIVQDVQQCVAAYEAVVEGKPFVERVVSVAGSAVREPGNYRVRVGTPVGNLLDKNLKCQGRIVIGSVLRGSAVGDLEIPIVKETPAVIALREAEPELFPVAGPGFDRDSFSGVYLRLPWVPYRRATTSLNGNPRPCVKCGYCVDVCPQNLVPALLGQYSANGLLSEAQEINIFACIECGLCAYVCPSKIPLLEQIREGKRKILSS